MLRHYLEIIRKLSTNVGGGSKLNDNFPADTQWNWSHFVEIGFHEVGSGPFHGYPLAQHIFVLHLYLEFVGGIFPNHTEIRFDRIDQNIPTQFIVQVGVYH